MKQFFNHYHVIKFKVGDGYLGKKGEKTGFDQAEPFFDEDSAITKCQELMRDDGAYVELHTISMYVEKKTVTLPKAFKRYPHDERGWVPK